MCPNTFAFRYFRLIRLRHVITPAITITRPTGCAKHEHGETHHVFGTSGPTTISAYPLYGHHLWMWYSPTPIILHSVLRAANRFPQCRIPLRPRTLAITEINPGSEGRLFRAALVFQRYKRCKCALGDGAKRQIWDIAFSPCNSRAIPASLDIGRSGFDHEALIVECRTKRPIRLCGYLLAWPQSLRDELAIRTRTTGWAIATIWAGIRI